MNDDELLQRLERQTRIRRYLTARHVAVRRYREALTFTIMLLFTGIGLTWVTRDPIAGAATGYTLALTVDLLKEGS